MAWADSQEGQAFSPHMMPGKSKEARSADQALLDDALAKHVVAMADAEFSA